MKGIPWTSCVVRYATFLCTTGAIVVSPSGGQDPTTARRAARVARSDGPRSDAWSMAQMESGAACPSPLRFRSSIAGVASGAVRYRHQRWLPRRPEAGLDRSDSGNLDSLRRGRSSWASRLQRSAPRSGARIKKNNNKFARNLPD